MPNHRNIVRFEYGRTQGWFLRVEQGNGTLRKLFSDKKHGGRSAALRAAVAKRDAFLSAHPASTRRGRSLPHGGVAERVKVKCGRQFWVGRIKLRPGAPHTATKRSVDLWGDDMALGLVLDWLQQKRTEQRRNYCAAGVRLPRERAAMVRYT